MPDTQRLARLPSVDRLLNSGELEETIDRYGRVVVVDALRHSIDAARVRMQADRTYDPAEAEIFHATKALVEETTSLSLRRVMNLTGTVVHTNLGRSAIPESAIDAVVSVARGASNLEYDLRTGSRGNRDSHLETAIKRLTGAEAATVVNNNAAAVMLVLNTLALGREVPVSRGELVEIGGSFRIPDIMSRSGCRLVEVGTTNRTHLSDFAGAIGGDTALVMKVHASNYVISGFTASVAEPQLAELCIERGVPFVVDLGSGSLVNLEDYGLPHEPTAAETLSAGADLVTFSTDKLLGGPQAGVIAGRSDLIQLIKSNPMKRALRCDKMTIAALAEVLRLYLDPGRIPSRVPTIRFLTRSTAEIEAMADRLLASFSRAVAGRAIVSTVECDSVVGSGALPTKTLPSRAIALRPVYNSRKDKVTIDRIAKAFASLPTPVIGRVSEGAFLLDLRCLDDVEELEGLVTNLAI